MKNDPFSYLHKAGVMSPSAPVKRTAVSVAAHSRAMPKGPSADAKAVSLNRGGAVSAGPGRTKSPGTGASAAGKTKTGKTHRGSLPPMQLKGGKPIMNEGKPKTFGPAFPGRS